MQAKLGEEEFTFRIKRESVLEDILEDAGSRSFNPQKIVKTAFVGEAGQDTGGITRELWRLFGENVKESLCEGREHALVLRHDSNRLKVYRHTYNILWCYRAS